MPSIVWWDIEAVVIDEFCKNEGEKQSDQSRLSIPAPIDLINTATLSAHLCLTEASHSLALNWLWRCGLGGRHSLVSLKGTFSWITLLLCFTCLLSSVWHRRSCCWLQGQHRNFRLNSSHSAVKLAIVKAACEANMKYESTTLLFAFCTPLFPSPGSVFSAIKQ